MSRMLFHAAALTAGLVAGQSLAAPIITNATGGWYNDSLGDVIPVAGDPTLTALPEPDLSGAAGALGNWLGIASTGDLNANWTFETPVPSSWAVGSETAIVYEITVGAKSDLSLSLGVDNGVFVWFNGSYVFGAMAPGGSSLGEYTATVADIMPGTHFLQILREDHGGSTGYDISAELVAPTTPVPLPAALPMAVAAFAGLGALRLRRRRG